MTNSLLAILALIAASSFFSVSEISLAASRRLKLQQLADDGLLPAKKIMQLQEQPGHFFTVVQIGLNVVAILGGIVGESALTPYFTSLLSNWLEPKLVETISFVCSFIIVTSLFILFADLIPKRLAMMAPERMAMIIVRPMSFCLILFKPLVWLFNGAANLVFRLFNIPTQYKEVLTSDDVYAMVSAGAQAGLLRKQEHQLIENVFELDTKTVPSAMTARDSIIYFDRRDGEDVIKQKIALNPHSKFLVCADAIDNVIGFVDTKDILLRIIQQQPVALNNEALVKAPLMIPDSLTLSETLDSFNANRQDFAIVLNEYALVVGIITLNDVMNTLMGDLVTQHNIEEQIVRRDEFSWLIDGAAPIDDVMRALEIDAFPDVENYETIAGFMMYVLRKIPKRTDSVNFAGFKFEVVDIDNYKIDQLLVTRIQIINPDNELA